MEYVFENDFLRLMNQVQKMGGSYKSAYLKVQEVILKWATGQHSDPVINLKQTDHGESRLKKCIKYKLPDNGRLVTLREKNMVIFLFIGSHAECDKWLDKKKGKKIQTFLDRSVNKIKKVEKIEYLPEAEIHYQYEKTEHEYTKERIIERLDDQYREMFCRHVGDSVVAQLNDVLYDENADDRVMEIAECSSPEKLSELIINVFVSLIKGEVSEAKLFIDEFEGNACLVENVSVEDIELADFEENLISRKDISDFDAFFKLIESEGFEGWINHLPSKLQKYSEMDFLGPAKLEGVVGSGKSSLIIRRARFLALKYKNDKIIVVTLNKSLSRLLNKMLELGSMDSEAIKNIEIIDFRALCEREFELPESLIQGGEKELDEMWMVFYRNQILNDEPFSKLHNYLIHLGVNAVRYIKQEIDFVQSMFTSKERSEEYRIIDRGGQSRRVKLADYTKGRILRILCRWETEQENKKLYDEYYLCRKRLETLQNTRYRYRCVIVDEAQDFSTMEIRLLKTITNMKNENSMFFAGDGTQKILPKNLSFKTAGIEFLAENQITFTENYRNNRKILSAALSVFKQSDFHMAVDEFSVCKPEPNGLHGCDPLCGMFNNIAEEFSFAVNYLENVMDMKRDKGLVIICGFPNYLIKEMIDFASVGIFLLGEEGNIQDNYLFVSDLELAKGYEFDYVFIINCSRDVIPEKGLPEGEVFRERRKWFMALTRAVRNIFISYSGEPSIFLEDICIPENDLKCKELIKTRNVNFKSVPSCKNAFYRHRDVFDLLGFEFVMSANAFGLEQSVLNIFRFACRDRTVSDVYINRYRSKLLESNTNFDGVEWIFENIFSESDRERVRQWELLNEPELGKFGEYCNKESNKIPPAKGDDKWVFDLIIRAFIKKGVVDPYDLLSIVRKKLEISVFSNKQKKRIIGIADKIKKFGWLDSVQKAKDDIDKYYDEFSSAMASGSSG